MLRDRRLGLLYYTLATAIFLYIVIYQLFMNGSYFTRDTPTGTVRFELWSPATDATGATCRLFEGGTCASRIDAADCGPTGSCLAWDGVTAGLMEQSSVLVTTRASISGWSGTSTGIYEDAATPNNWDLRSPAPAAPVPAPTDHFIADVEDMTLSIFHSFFVHTKGSEDIRGMSGDLTGGHLLVGKDVPGAGALCSDPARFAREGSWAGAWAGADSTTEAPCYIRPDSWTQECENACKDMTICDEGGHLNARGINNAQPKHKRCFVDVFRVGTLLAAAGVELDSANAPGTNSKTTRHTGTVIDLVTWYTNIKFWHLGATDRVNYYCTSVVLLLL